MSGTRALDIGRLKNVGRTDLSHVATAARFVSAEIVEDTTVSGYRNKICARVRILYFRIFPTTCYSAAFGITGYSSRIYTSYKACVLTAARKSSGHFRTTLDCADIDTVFHYDASDSLKVRAIFFTERALVVSDKAARRSICTADTSRKNAAFKLIFSCITENTANVSAGKFTAVNDSINVNIAKVTTVSSGT